MKHNRIWMLSVFAVSAILLSGCMSTKELDEEEENLIAEYSAGVLLRYSEQYDFRLITSEQVGDSGAGSEGQPQNTPAPEATATPEPAGQSAGQGEGTGGETSADSSAEGQQEAQSVPLNDLYHIEGLDFSFNSYRFCNQYPKKTSGDIAPLMAEEGETMLVAEFTVKNQSGGSKKVKLGKRNIQYTLDVDGMKFQPRINIMDNMGLNYLDTTIKKGGTEKAALIFTMEKSRENASAISLTIQDGENTSIVQLK